MKKTLCIVLTLLFVALAFAGCGADTAVEVSTGSGSDVSGTVSSDGETRTIVDHAGNEVTLPVKIDRIAVADIFPLPSVLTVFFDSAEKIVAMSSTSMTAAANGLLSELYPEILNADTSAINGAQINTEELMKSDPQVVFYSATNGTLGDDLTKAGFNAVGVSADKWGYNAVETLNQWLDLLTRIFPDEANDRADFVRSYSEEAMELVSSRTAALSDEDRARVFFLFQYSDESIVTSGNNFFGQWWADAIGAVNVGEELDEDNSVKTTMEQVYVWNPDTVLITNFNPSTPDDLYNNTVGSYDWSGVDAVAYRRVFKMPLGMYRSYTPGVDTPITLQWMAKTVYPDLFEDIDITAKTIDYYKAIFGVDLTAEQAEAIFNPAAAAGVASVGN